MREDGAVEKLESAGYRCIAPPVSRLTGETTEAAWSIVEAATAATRSGRKAAIVVGAHGIMVEVHPDPDKALCDGAQSLTGEGFGQLVKELQRLQGVLAAV